jgi:hypothetical protein
MYHQRPAPCGIIHPRHRRQHLVACAVVAAALGSVTFAPAAHARPTRQHNPRILHFGAGAGAAAHPPASPDPGTMLGGFTSQDWPIVLDVPPRGHRVALAVTPITIQCAGQQQLVIDDGMTGVAIKPDGRVDATGPLPPTSAPGLTITGGTHSLTGGFNRARTRFTGVWQVREDYSDASGQTQSCSSGPVRLRAIS